jgi:predicted nucleic acid-binding protein
LIVYLDASALLKLFLVEEGSAEVERIWDQADRLTTSRVTFPEARSALAAGQRSGRIGQADLAVAVRELRRRWGEVNIIELDEGLGEAAGDLAERHAMRALDAIHLASALAGGKRVVVATWDDRLAQAAREAGLALAP